jgi:putative zinc finger/helix-turn-helix YgiT family protein
MKFPKCPNCRDRTIQTVIESYSTTLEHDGRSYNVTVPNLPVPVCSKCGYRTLDREANTMLGAALRDAAGLMQPENIRECREELGLSQKVLADHLSIAPATLSRWETGAQIQQRGYDDRLRDYFKFPVVRRECAVRMGVPGGKVVVAYDDHTPTSANRATTVKAGTADLKLAGA